MWRSLVPLGSVRCGVPGVVVRCCCCCFCCFYLLSLGVESYIGLVGLRRLGRCEGLFRTPLFFLCFPFSSLSVCVYVSVRWLSLGSCLFLPSRGLWLVVVFLSISLHVLTSPKGGPCLSCLFSSAPRLALISRLVLGSSFAVLAVAVADVAFLRGVFHLLHLCLLADAPLCVWSVSFCSSLLFCSRICSFSLLLSANSCE